MAKLSTHVLDTRRGQPASGLRIDLYRIHRDDRELVLSVHTNQDGRTDEPLLQGEALRAGTYELVFHAGDYFATQELNLPQPPFVDRVSVHFGVANPEENYHVPLLVTPWSWSTYRGS